jgi:hypothetical protein
MFLRLVAKMSDRFLEQRINIKFCVKLGNNASDTYEMPSEAYGGETTKKSSVPEWHKPFKRGSEEGGRCQSYGNSTKSRQRDNYVRRKRAELCPNDRKKTTGKTYE